ncbi:MAG: transcriptional repressor [Candidatus Accumulibacter sp.]|jgi:Fe2+ or Zn2+ uptake regulation protein|nr:transcriptional repressor [Accumulibacter sp.]
MSGSPPIPSPSAQEVRIVRSLRAAWLRPTLARVKVLEMLSENPGFQDVNTVYRWVVRKEIPVTLGTVYHALQSLNKAGFLLCVWGVDHVLHYSLKSGTDVPRLRIVCGENGDSADFSDPELYVWLLSAAVREGLDLTGREFELRVDFARQSADSGEESAASEQASPQAPSARPSPRKGWQVIEGTGKPKFSATAGKQISRQGY